MKTLIEAFNSIDIVSYAFGGLSAFLISFIRIIFLEFVDKGKESKK